MMGVTSNPLRRARSSPDDLSSPPLTPSSSASSSVSSASSASSSHPAHASCSDVDTAASQSSLLTRLRGIFPPSLSASSSSPTPRPLSPDVTDVTSSSPFHDTPHYPGDRPSLKLSNQQQQQQPRKSKSRSKSRSGSTTPLSSPPDFAHVHPETLNSHDLSLSIQKQRSSLEANAKIHRLMWDAGLVGTPLPEHYERDLRRLARREERRVQDEVRRATTNCTLPAYSEVTLGGEVSLASGSG